jgi:hypothetical protein
VSVQGGDRHGELRRRRDLVRDQEDDMAEQEQPSEQSAEPAESQAGPGGGDVGEPPEHLAGEEVKTALIEGETFSAKAVQYAVVDGYAIFEGDIILGRDEALQEHSNELQAGLAERARGIGAEATPGDAVDPAVSEPLAAVVVTGQSRRWPGGIVPFEVATNLPTAQNTAVTNAITHWHDNTRLFFRQRTAADAQWVRFQPGSGCNSEVGRQTPSIFSPAPQVINLAAGCQFGQAVHEVGHAVGLWHEQSREDRDTFVTILWQNIESGQSHNFDQHISDGDDVGTYEYGSIMHYGPTAFGRVIPPSTAPATTIVAKQTLPPGVTMGQRNGLSVGDRAAVAWMYGGIYPAPANTWVGRFRGAGDELLYYSPARRRWFLTQLSGATMTFVDVSDTTGFGDLADGRPIWAGDFNGDGRTDVLFYFPGDDNWWLGTLSGTQLAWSHVGNTAGFGHAINDGRPFWTADFTGNGSTDVLFYYPGDDNWWLGQVINGQLQWSFVGNTAGFGHAINDGRPFWIGDFNGDGRADVLFYYPGDDNWWLGTLQGGQLSWSLVGNTAGFGHAINDGRPFWTADFTGNGSIDVLFYYPGDDNWWLGQLINGQLAWSFAGNTAGFGHAINDGRPFWIGDFSGDGRADVLFYFPGDDNWWLGSIVDVPGEHAQCATLRAEIADLRGDIADLQQAKLGLDPRNPLDRAEIRNINLQITAKSQQITQRQGQMAQLGCPVTPNPGGKQLGWTHVGNTSGFGHAINDGRPFWIGNFSGSGGVDVLFHYRGDLNWWRGNVVGSSLGWTLAATW